jgi:two-component system OmpR family sensor kinase
MLERLSLRARLVLGVIALAAAGLAIADVATYASLRSFLLDRTDRSLDSAYGGAEPVSHEFRGPPFGTGAGAGPRPQPRHGRAGPGLRPARVASGDFVQLRAAGGSTVYGSRQTPRFSDGVQSSPPRLPARVTATERPSYFTVAAQDDNGRYRVRAGRVGSSVLLVATPLHDVDSTLRRLLLIELLVTAGVLAALAALGLWVVRLGLRPLASIEATAAAIAAGDLTRRVEREDARTEVGRLGGALNAMLAQIEAAFRAREASEQRLRRFVADASHELRTPLSAVRAYAELFSRGAARHPDDLARSMAGISRESERMSVLVDDLLLLARLDEGRPLEREPVELAGLVGEAVETARAVDPERPIACELQPSEVLGDRVRLRQIVDNLLANVRSHTPAGAAARVTLGRENGSAVIEVSDSGPGIAQEQIDRVFERFYRADPSRARASGGVGLGLAIVAAVAEAHGGRVSAHASPGGGSTFRIELPLGE